jgi:hypothetical protein
MSGQHWHVAFMYSSDCVTVCMKLNFTLPLRVEIRNFLLYSMRRSEGEGNVGIKGNENEKEEARKNNGDDDSWKL